MCLNIPYSSTDRVGSHFQNSSALYCAFANIRWFQASKEGSSHRSTEIKAAFSSDGPWAVLPLEHFGEDMPLNSASYSYTICICLCHTDQNTTNQGGGAIRNSKLWRHNKVREFSNPTEVWFNYISEPCIQPLLSQQGKDKFKSRIWRAAASHTMDGKWQLMFNLWVQNIAYQISDQAFCRSPPSNPNIIKQLFMLFWALNITKSNDLKSQM